MINLLVDHVGLLELLRLCLIDYVLLLVRQYRPVSPLKISSPVVDSLVDLDVMVVSPVELGVTSREPD